MYCGCFDLFESQLYCSEFIHFFIYFVSEHLVDKGVGQIYLPPLLLTQILILNRPLSNLHQIVLPLTVYVLQLQLLLDHRLQIPYMLFPLSLLLLQFQSKFIVYLCCPVFALAIIHAFLLEDAELLATVFQFFLACELPLVIYHFIALVAPLHRQ